MKQKLLDWLYDHGWMRVKDFEDNMIERNIVIGSLARKLFASEKENNRLCAELDSWRPIIDDIRFGQPTKKPRKRPLS